MTSTELEQELREMMPLDLWLEGKRVIAYLEEHLQFPINDGRDEDFEDYYTPDHHWRYTNENYKGINAYSIEQETPFSTTIRVYMWNIGTGKKSYYLYDLATDFSTPLATWMNLMENKFVGMRRARPVID